MVRKGIRSGVVGAGLFMVWLLAAAVGCATDTAGPEASSGTGEPGGQEFRPTPDSLKQHEIPAWWDEGKLGIFIHWGPASVPGFSSRAPTVPGGWYYWGLHLGFLTQVAPHHLEVYGPDVVYDDFIEEFTAERFDPDAWIALFEEAGARYFVLTAKHHDGFALWPSDVSGRDAGEMGPRRDLIGELFDAAARAGNRVRPGLYYSIPEFFPSAPCPLQTEMPWPGWVVTGGLGGAALFNPSLESFCLAIAPRPEECQPFYKGPPRNPFTREVVPYTGSVPMEDYAADQVRPQIRELVERYRPGVLWCDIGGPEGYFRANEFIAWYYNEARRLVPEGVIVNDRCGDDTTHRDYVTVEVNAEYVRGGSSAETRGELTVPLGFSYYYDRMDRESDYRTVDELVDTLVTAVSRNQNMLLGVGPMSDGIIPEIQAERLRGLGSWLRRNGAAIYGARPWREAPEEGPVRFSVGADQALYITSLEWPGDRLVVEAPVPVTSETRIVLIGSDQAALAYEFDGSRLVIEVPARETVRGDHAFVFRVTGLDDLR
jgi:alpha-L-fucosidase